MALGAGADVAVLALTLVATDVDAICDGELLTGVLVLMVPDDPDDPPEPDEPVEPDEPEL